MGYYLAYSFSSPFCILFRYWQSQHFSMTFKWKRACTDKNNIFKSVLEEAIGLIISVSENSLKIQILLYIQISY